jgi:hypothetical protein
MAPGRLLASSKSGTGTWSFRFRWPCLIHAQSFAYAICTNYGRAANSLIKANESSKTARLAAIIPMPPLAQISNRRRKFVRNSKQRTSWQNARVLAKRTKCHDDQVESLWLHVGRFGGHGGRARLRDCRRKTCSCYRAIFGTNGLSSCFVVNSTKRPNETEFNSGFKNWLASASSVMGTGDPTCCETLAS